jgi:hypothetical protein
MNRLRSKCAARVLKFGTFAAAATLLSACGSTAPPAPSATLSPLSSSPAASRAPVLVLDPAHGALGVTLHVTGSGYGPKVELTGTICAVDAQGDVQNPLAQCDIANIVTVTTDTHGGFTAAYTLNRLPTRMSGYQIGFGTAGDAGESAGAAFVVDP